MPAYLPIPIPMSPQSQKFLEHLKKNKKKITPLINLFNVYAGDESGV